MLDRRATLLERQRQVMTNCLSSVWRKHHIKKCGILDVQPKRGEEGILELEDKLESGAFLIYNMQMQEGTDLARAGK